MQRIPNALTCGF